MLVNPLAMLLISGSVLRLLSCLLGHQLLAVGVAHVNGEDGFGRELSLAVDTLEALAAILWRVVGQHMPLEIGLLIESPIANAAFVRLDARMRQNMAFEIGRLKEIDFNNIKQ